VRERARIIRNVHDIVLRDNSEILDAIQRETGKARAHAMEEIFHVAMNSAYIGRTASRTLRTQRRPGLFPLLTRTRVRAVPKGVVGVITPWNYPFTLSLSDALAALAAGNSVVIKPDEQTAWSALHAVEVLGRAGLPEGVASVVVGDGRTIGGALIDEVDYVCFTGSTATGRVVAERAARRLIGTSLELGGKNPMIVCADADIDRFLDIAVHACFTSAGQLCVSTERMYVHRDIYEEVVSRLVSRVESLKVDARLGWGYDVGSLTTIAQRDRVLEAVNNAVEQGATIATGGYARADIGALVVMPTVLTNVTPSMAISHQEVFGPVVFVTPFDDINQAIAMANDSPYGLSASVITKNASTGEAIAAKIHSGSVNVNDGFGATFGSVSAPMGGVGDSGLGRRHGPEGMLRFTEAQTISTQRLLWPTPPFGMSPKTWSRVMSAALRILKAMHIR
jgi:succinate-semialdehyde dehydrogenase/glutarate-semialdehyde dehydrogenase